MCFDQKEHFYIGKSIISERVRKYSRIEADGADSFAEIYLARLKILLIKSIVSVSLERKMFSHTSTYMLS